MARTRSLDYHDKRRRIQREAARLFAEHSYAGTSIDMIAQACGSSKSWLYHYYRSNEVLLYDLLREHLEVLNAVIESSLSVGGEPRERLRRVMVALVEAYVDEREKLVVLMNDIGNLPREQQREVEALERAMIHRVRSVLHEIVPDLDPATLHASTMALFGMINWVYTWFRTGGDLDPVAYGTLAARILLDGVESVGDDESKRGRFIS